MPDWSPEQLRAIQDADDSLLVSAAAGSGKTATLSERCAHLVCDKRLCKANELLVVTFTEEAAGEMKSRVEKAIRQRLDARPNDAWVKQQLSLLPGAQISTIHAFCARLLKQHFQAIELDPAFAVLDEQEAMLLQREVAAELFEDAFAAGDPRFTALVDYYADGKDIRIEDQVIATHNVLSSLTDADGWRSNAIERLREVERADDLFQTQLGREFRSLALARIGELKTHALVLAGQFTDLASTGCGEAAQAVHDHLVAVENLLAGDWSAAGAMVQAWQPPRLESPPRGAVTPEERKCATDRLKSVRDPVKPGGSIYEMFARTPAELRAEVVATIAPAECFLDLVGEFSRRYAAAKRRDNVVDFSDLEHLALRVLEDPAIAAQCRNRFASIMVDEFQDVNALQWELLRRVSRPDEAGRPVNLFCVGDVKQSIYRFRLADPSIFMSRQAEWDPLDRVIYMRHNFRSRRPLLDAINCIFRDLMRKSCAEIDYTTDQELDGKRSFPPGGNTFTGSPIELHLLPEKEKNKQDDDQPATDDDDAGADLTRIEAEAEYTAQLIEKLLASGKLVTNRDGTRRPLECRDIAVLLRSAKQTIVEYSRAIAARGIPVFAESRTGFFQASEINEILSILRLLDNQQQDIPMAAVLRGQILAVPQPETSMAQIRLTYRDLPFHAAVVAYAREQQDDLARQVRDMLARLDRWRKRALLASVADLLWEILTHTNYIEYCRALKAGAQRVANLLYLHRCARKFSGFRQQGLFRFLQYIEQLEDRSDLGQPSPGEAGNAVRVMTVHASKGLEFPVVILSGINSKWNLRDCSGAILVQREQGIAVSVADPRNDIRYPTVTSWLSKDIIRRASLAEELRVLYVAMTRAEEHLILIGTCTAKKRDNARTMPPVSADPAAFSSAASMLDWLLPLVDKSAGQIVLLDAAITAEQPTPQATPDAEPAAAPAASEIWTYRYPHDAITRLAASNSVTGLSKGDETPTTTPDATNDAPDDIISDDTTEPGETAAGQEARERGIAVHLFMEHFDFAPAAPAPAEQLKSLVDRAIITAQQAHFIDPGDIHWLLQQPALSLLFRTASAIHREIPMLDTDLVGADDLDRILVRGRIDAIVATPDGLVVVDYKTDRNFPEPGSDREQAYRKQMQLYRQAIEHSGLGRVASIKLVFLRARRVLEL